MDIRTRYTKVEGTANVESVVPPTSWNVDDVSDWLSSQISEILLDAPVSLTGDLFEQGLDRWVVGHQLNLNVH